MQISYWKLHPVKSEEILYPDIEEIESHICSEAELSKFHDVKESERLGFEIYKPFYQCFDYSKVSHQGTLRSSEYERIIIEFIIPQSECRFDPYDVGCVTTAEYEASLGNLIISVMTNKTRFN